MKDYNYQLNDIVEMKNLLEQIWEADNRILEKLAAIN